MTGYSLFLVALFAVTSALPADPVIFKLDEQRFQYVTDDEGIPHLVDLWVKASDLKKSARFNPDIHNAYHLFTRNNPSRSQVIVFGDESSLTGSSFDAKKRTAVVIHGWMNSASSDVNNVIVPVKLLAHETYEQCLGMATREGSVWYCERSYADCNCLTPGPYACLQNSFLIAEDMNVIVVDWSTGASLFDYTTAVVNTVPSGRSVARFITWVNSVTGASLSSYHITGHSLGGHQAGIVGRNLGGEVAYITALDPASPGWNANNNRFSSTDGVYTEVIHTNVGVSGYLNPLGDADFYPNGGISMPGCNSQTCDHSRSFFYFAESLISGGFRGTRCASYLTAMAGTCYLWGGLNMGGLTPKTRQSGVFYLETNAAPPFSQS